MSEQRENLERMFGQAVDLSEVTDEEFTEAMAAQLRRVGKILERLFDAEANGQPLRLKVKEAASLAAWIRSVQDINSVMEAQLQSLGEAYVAQQEELSEFRRQGSKMWRPGT